MTNPVPARLRRGLDRAASASAEQAVASGFVAGWRVVRWLPEPQGRRLFRVAAERIYRLDGRGVRRLRSNLHRVLPELSDTDLEPLVHRAVRSYFGYWCESFRLPSWPSEDLVSRVRTVHEERLRAPYAEGRGVIMPLPHQANWDWAGAWASATGIPVTTVAERLHPERLYDEFVDYRAKLGIRILPLTGGQPPLPVLEEALRGGAFVPLLADRDLSRNGVEVTLCGHRSRMPPGPALLAQQTGAALVPLTLAYVGDEQRPDLELSFAEEVVVGPGPDGVARAMQQVADVFSTGLRAHPADWHMMQTVFSDDVAPR
ncbi:MAG: phosphatidylinositol dimannoside acyltransferase [Nocardioidaceae bacterium]|nr:phosphatidylinositol dimannoside acyltransferase [Nocardioidaceae bacterium]